MKYVGLAFLLIICVIAMKAAIKAPLPRETSYFLDSQKHVKARLKNPGSAQFQLVTTFQNKWGDMWICGAVKAKNSFNSFNGPIRYVYEKMGNNLDMENESENFERLWQTMCMIKSGTK